MIPRLLPILFLSIIKLGICGEFEKNTFPTSFSGLGEKHPWLEDLGTVPSDSGKKLKELLQSWRSASGTEAFSLPVEVIGYETPGNPFYVGAAQRMIIESSFERAQAIVDDFTHYVGIFDGLISVKSVMADGNRVITEWEESIPIPFVRNERNQMIYLVSSPKPGLRVYRYGLKESNHLLRSDGFIVLERLATGKTLFTEYDFFDADLGIVKSFGPKKFWDESVEGLFQTDFALKLRAEHGDWSKKQVLEESKKLLKKAPVGGVFENRRPFGITHADHH